MPRTIALYHNSKLLGGKKGSLGQNKGVKILNEMGRRRRSTAVCLSAKGRWQLSKRLTYGFLTRVRGGEQKPTKRFLTCFSSSPSVTGTGNTMGGAGRIIE
jgi:hypothetical protein